MKEDVEKKDDKTLEELIQELEATGYQKYQIKDIIMDACNKKDITKLTTEEEQQVRQALVNYLEFALKCWQKTT
jgi:flagellar basal body-associated protein FliL